MSIVFSKSRAALVIAHPGHELRVYYWLLLARPCCFVLTDGSGKSGDSRLPATTKILEQTGAKTGRIYGGLTDRAIYAAIIDGNIDLFINLTEELAQALVSEQIEYVVGDSIEGYNPAHDVCRLVINAAVAIANRTENYSILNFEIPLATDPTNYPKALLADAMQLDLDEDTFAKKLEAVRAYPEMTVDVDRVLEREGMRAIQTEFLRPVSNCFTCDGLISERPYYEIYGEKQVAAGYYEQVLRYNEHVRPLAEALRSYSKSGDR